MKEYPLVSVVIPAYNVEEYIEKCIDSVLAQSYSRLEIIIVNDGSDDDTGSICARLLEKDGRIRVFDKKNSGVVSARQTGLDNASGEYVMFVDADDWIESTMVEYMLNHIGDADLMCVGAFFDGESSSFEIIDRYEEGEYDGERLIDIYKSMIYQESDHTLHVLQPQIWARLFKRDLALEQHKRLDPRLRFAEDCVFLYLYVLSCQKAVISHACFYHYVQREGSIMHSKSSMFLRYISETYDFMKQRLIGFEGIDIEFQLQEWVIYNLIFSINERMGFDERCYIPEYVFDIDGIEGLRIVLYGAGKVGKSFYYSQQKLGINVVSWVDKNYSDYKKQGLSVHSVESVMDCDFDYVYIAVENEDVSRVIKESLIEYGCPLDKIIWRKPYRLIF